MSEVGPDQKPLIPIHKKSLLNAPKRLQRMLLGALKYDYEVVYKKGTDMFVADTLSRALEKNSTRRMKTEKKEIFQTDDWYGPLIWRHMSLFRRKDWLNYSQQPGKIQISVCLLMKIIQSDWPEHRKEVQANLRLYFPFREELSILNGLIFKTKRTVIPAIGKTRESIMQALHKSHTGLQGCLRRAREVVYWPGLHTDLEKFLSQYEPCQTLKKEPNQRTPVSHPIPDMWRHINGPYQSSVWKISSFSVWTWWTTQVRATLSQWTTPRISLRSTDFKTKLQRKWSSYKLKAHFARHGELVVSDNGPPFQSSSSEGFVTTWGFQHVTSSPKYP